MDYVNTFYYCPWCQPLEEFVTINNRLTCSKCFGPAIKKSSSVKVRVSGSGSEGKTSETDSTPVSSNKGIKYDKDKPPLHLLPFESLFEIAKVLDHGQKKYDAHNWRKGMAWSRLGRAAIGHIFNWMMGQEKDSESGLSHLAHAGCCVLFLISYTLTNTGEDDRWNS